MMVETLGVSLRDNVYRRIFESDGCYILIYLGMGEKLSFLSSFSRDLTAENTEKMVIDFTLKQHVTSAKMKGSITIDSLPETSEKNDPESYCLKLAKEEVAKFTNAHSDLGHLAIVVDISSVLLGNRKPLEENLSPVHQCVDFHENMLRLISSVKGVTGILLYDANSLSEERMSDLIKLHQLPERSASGMTLKGLKEESSKRTKMGNSYREVVVSRQGIMFLDPASESAALLVPITKAIEEVLPRDPLNVAHRDIAFTNNYTSQPGACPYWSADVESGCLLDPKAIRAANTEGRSFIEGCPCITAVDYMVYDARQERNDIDTNTSGQDRSNQNGTIECANGGAGALATVDNAIPVKHPATNQRLKMTVNCRTAKLPR